MVKKILFILFGLFTLYVVYLYAFGARETFLIPDGYNGPLIIIANQKDGINSRTNNAIYDFTKSNILKLKGDFVSGFFPWGYLNYYTIDRSGNRHKMKVIDDVKERNRIKDNDIYVWNCYAETGGCTVTGYKQTNYETIIVGTVSTIDSILEAEKTLVNEAACKATPITGN